jgi:molecular chaperone DnaK
MAYHKVIGIDLGTTYSAVSLWDDERNETVVIPSPVTGLTTVPSVVGLDPEGKVIVGAQAQNNLIMDPQNTVIEVKRIMGTCEIDQATKREDPNRPVRIPFRGRQYLPQEVSALILMELKRMAENHLGEPVHDAVITVPAYFKEPQKGATLDAGAMARLNVKRLLNEPTAAAVCFGADKIKDGRKHTYAVYDLGGGTFDVSIIDVTAASEESGGNVTVVGTGGDPKLGGGDFDDRITGWAMQQIKQRFGVDLSSDPLIWARIKREAEMRKRELSTAGAATLNLPYLTSTISVNLPITRSIFEGLIEDLLAKSLTGLNEAIESAFKSASIQREDIEQVLLVGGSTRVPKVRTMIAERMGMDIKDVRCDFNPDEVVSRGAAIVARSFRGCDSYEGKEVIIDMAPAGAAAGGESGALATPPKRTILYDVTSHTLGVLANESTYVPIILKDSHIPTSQTQGGFINGGPTDVLDVLIFQGEDPVAFKNTLIGKLPLNLPERKEAGKYNFEVKFDLDTNGLLSVDVMELNTKKNWQTAVQCNVRANKAVIDESARQLADAMAAALAAVPDGPPLQAGELPKPSSAMPRPPIPTRPAVPPQPAAAQNPMTSPIANAQSAVPPPLPTQVPDEFRSVARKSFKRLNEMGPSPARDQLLKSYSAFVAAINSQSSEAQDLGDELGDVYMKCMQ